MDEPLDVPAVDVVSKRLFVGLFPAALAFFLVLLFVPPGGTIVLIAFLPALVVAAGSLLWMRRLSGRGTRLDAVGIGPTEGGTRLFTLEWSRFGGFRIAAVPIWRRLTRPHEAGYEILDRDGVPVFVAPVNAHTRTTLAQAMRHEMIRRAPADAPRGERTAEGPPPVGSVRSAFAWSAFWLGVAVWGLSQPILSRLALFGLLGCLALPAALLLAYSRLCTRRGWAEGRLPYRETPPPLPEEGPDLVRHVALRERSPLRLEEGGRYRTVEPERLRAELIGSRSAIRRAIAADLALLGCFGIAYDPRMWELIALLAFFFGGALAILVAHLRALPFRLTAVDDVIWVREGALIVVRSGREPFALPRPTSSDRQARFRRAWLEATDVLRGPTGERYYLDRTRLYAAEIPHGI